MKNILKNLKGIFSTEHGFGLIEVIIGITMLILTATAALSLSRTSIKAESFNSHRVVAYNLGQQIMEEVRRTRDSAWDDLNPDTRWLVGSDDLLNSLNNYEGESGFCDISDEPDYDIKCRIPYDFEVPENTDNPDINPVNYYVNLDVTDIEDFATKHDGDDGYGLSVNRGSEIDDRLAKRVYIDVMWKEAGSERHFELISLLTDWKPAI